MKTKELFGIREVTPKMLRSFMASEQAGLDGIGFNDAWNVAKYGITRAEASNIRMAMVDLYGMRPFWPKSPCLTEINTIVHGIGNGRISYI